MAKIGIRAGRERTERGGLLPGAGVVRTPFLRLEIDIEFLRTVYSG